MCVSVASVSEPLRGVHNNMNVLLPQRGLVGVSALTARLRLDRTWTSVAPGRSAVTGSGVHAVRAPMNIQPAHGRPSIVDARTDRKTTLAHLCRTHPTMAERVLRLRTGT